MPVTTRPQSGRPPERFQRRLMLIGRLVDPQLAEHATGAQIQRRHQMDRGVEGVQGAARRLAVEGQDARVTDGRLAQEIS